MNESESKQRNQRSKRRDRAHQLQQEKLNLNEDGSGDEGDESPPRTSKDKGGRAKPRRRRNSASGTMDEVIIDGFAIMSFKTLEDVELLTGKSPNNIKKCREEEPHSRPSSPHAEKKVTKKKTAKKSSPTPETAETTEEESHSSHSEEPHLNGPSKPPRSISRDRLSDASTHSSSGQGYICDSESGDDKVSESGSDLFNAVSHTRPPTECHRPPSPFPISSPPPPPPALCNGAVPTVTTTTTTSPTTSATSGVTTCSTTTTTTTSCTTPTTTASASSSSRPPSRPPVLPLSTTPTLKRPSPVPARQPSPPPPPPRTHPPTSTTTAASSASLSLSLSSSSSLTPSSTLSSSRELLKPLPPISRTTPRREDIAERDVRRPPSGSFVPSPFSSKPTFWSSTPPGLYSGALGHPPSLHSSLHPLTPHSSAFPAHVPATALHPHPPVPHSMFAAPLPPGPPLTSTALSAPPPSNHFHDSLIRSNPDYLHQDLNNRLLAHNRDVAAAAASATVPPYLPRETTHHHNHLHNHQHMHQHTYGGALGPPPISNLVPTPSPHLGTELNPFSSLSFQYDKIPKAYESGLYRPSLLQGYAGFSLLPQAPTATPGHISSSLHGAFQPKARPATGSFFKESAAMNPGQVMLPLRDREKPAPSTASLPPKKGKWCAVHVRIAWEIYHHQQKLDSKGGDPKHPADPLRLIGPRPPDLASHTLPTSLFSGVGRSLMDGIPHPSSGFLGHGPLAGMSSFPRPSPHPLGTSLTSFGGLGSLFGNAPGREISAVPGLTSPQEWSRLQRTPSSFPTWPKPDYEREKELEREREREQERREQERERERELERKKEEERERERRLAESRSLGMLELERSSRDKYRDGVRPPSRSRSRSPIRNGRLEPPKPDPMLEKAGLMKLKEERRPEDELLERDKMFRSLGTVPGMPPDYLGLPGPLAPSSAASLVGLNMMDRSRMLAPPPVTHYLPGAIERAPTHPSLWSPFDKVGVSSAAAAAAAWDLERERMARLGSMAYDERLLRDQQEREDIRRYYERLPQLERERAIMEQAKMTGMRPEHFFNRTLSPALNHVSSKSNSPAGLPGGPPPLISSAIAGHPPGFHTSLPPHSLAHAHSLAHHAHSARSHDNSPTSSKTKGYSPADSTTDGKDKRDSNSTDPEAHSR